LHNVAKGSTLLYEWIWNPEDCMLQWVVVFVFPPVVVFGFIVFECCRSSVVIGVCCWPLCCNVFCHFSCFVIFLFVRYYLPVCKVLPSCLLVWYMDSVLYPLPTIYFLCIVVPINKILAVQKKEKKNHFAIFWFCTC
jgi:hypothetical protein